ncbi:MipA/OmpV family protein [Erwinia sorbitola]|uniref:MipA/OmpV family protein n=1 Tax=Erwinia sorbitola TaxID=2681984 RepID=A0A6I6EYA0_9GAMM|nr:MipA/OmpV family protein [Erwinia sorbitola]MTD28613.1 MipA/OmpV family protein [Erwinia sorbitola]QGU86720.1 MipA/OmpV family protein [Erwinia sorbitola]
MITRKFSLCISCIAFANITLMAGADAAVLAARSLTVGIAASNAPRYSGSDKRQFNFAPVIDARDGAFFFNSQDGLGYDLQSDSGLYLEHTLGYSLGRSDKNSSWRDGSKKLRGMGNIDAVMNTAVAVGWTIVPWLSVEGKATLPLTDSQGVQYQTSVSLIPFQDESDTLVFQSAALFGDSRYMNTFYGVSDRQHIRSGYRRYSTTGGLYGVQNSLTWGHRFTPQWGTMLEAGYTWLSHRTDKSPIVFRRNEATVTAAVTYTFD